MEWRELQSVEWRGGDCRLQAVECGVEGTAECGVEGTGQKGMALAQMNREGSSW